MPRKVSPKKYSNILANIEIKKIGFLEISSNFNVEALKEGAISVDAKNEVEITHTENIKTFAAIDGYQLTGRLEEKTLFTIKIKIMVVFNCKAKPEEEFLKLFEQNTLKVITYPYVREEVQSLTTKMGITPLVLPMWRVPIQAKQKYLKPSEIKESDEISKNIQRN
jgi:preprotein translocase subunit SecB